MSTPIYSQMLIYLHCGDKEKALSPKRQQRGFRLRLPQLTIRRSTSKVLIGTASVIAMTTIRAYGLHVAPSSLHTAYMQMIAGHQKIGIPISHTAYTQCILIIHLN